MPVCTAFSGSPAENVDYIHLINVSQAVRKLDVELPDGNKLFGGAKQLEA